MWPDLVSQDEGPSWAGGKVGSNLSCRYGQYRVTREEKSPQRKRGLPRTTLG